MLETYIKLSMFTILILVTARPSKRTQQTCCIHRREKAKYNSNCLLIPITQVKGCSTNKNKLIKEPVKNNLGSIKLILVVTIFKSPNLGKWTKGTFTNLLFLKTSFPLEINPSLGRFQNKVHSSYQYKVCEQYCAHAFYFPAGTICKAFVRYSYLIG